MRRPLVRRRPEAAAGAAREDLRGNRIWHGSARPPVEVRTVPDELRRARPARVSERDGERVERARVRREQLQAHVAVVPRAPRGRQQCAPPVVLGQRGGRGVARRDGLREEREEGVVRPLRVEAEVGGDAAREVVVANGEARARRRPVAFEPRLDGLREGPHAPVRARQSDAVAGRGGPGRVLEEPRAFERRPVAVGAHRRAHVVAVHERQRGPRPTVDGDRHVAAARERHRGEDRPTVPPSHSSCFRRLPFPAVKRVLSTLDSFVFGSSIIEYTTQRI